MSESNGQDVKQLMMASATRRRGSRDVPGVGLIHIQNMTELERSRIEKSISAGEDGSTIRARVISICQTDSEGNRLWSDYELPTICDMDSAVTAAVFDALDDFCSEVSTTTEEAVKN